MTAELVEILRRRARALEPIPTEVAARLAPLPEIRAVMFDIYGTLLISGSGDVGTVAAAPGQAFSQACQAVGLELTVACEMGANRLVEAISDSHQQSRASDVEYPEVDIVAVWRRTIADLRQRQWLETDIGEVNFERLAVEYEVRANPVWKMPGLEGCLERLAQAGLHLGIISNAQFYTPLLFPALLDNPLSKLGFSANLCFYSYQHGRAKPDTFLFEKAKESLQRLGLSAGEVLYIGNDMLNDVTPARAVGFKTALFAGDRRSLRLRQGDQRVEGAAPDVVVTQLDQLVCVLNLDNMESRT